MHLTLILGSPNYTVRLFISFAKLQLGNKKECSSLVINCHHKDHCAKPNSQRKKRQPWELSRGWLSAGCGVAVPAGTEPARRHRGSRRLSPGLPAEPGSRASPASRGPAGRGRQKTSGPRRRSSERLALLSSRHRRWLCPGPVIKGVALGGEQGGKTAVRVIIKREEGGVPALMRLPAFVLRVVRRRWGRPPSAPGLRPVHPGPSPGSEGDAVVTGVKGGPLDGEREC